MRDIAEFVELKINFRNINEQLKYGCRGESIMYRKFLIGILILSLDLIMFDVIFLLVVGVGSKTQTDHQLWQTMISKNVWFGYQLYRKF